MKRILINILVSIGIIIAFGIAVVIFLSTLLWLSIHVHWLKNVFIWTFTPIIIAVILYGTYREADILVFKYKWRKVHGNKPWWK